MKVGLDRFAQGADCGRLFQEPDRLAEAAPLQGGKAKAVLGGWAEGKIPVGVKPNSLPTLSSPAGYGWRGFF